MSSTRPLCKIGDVFIVNQEGQYSELDLKAGSRITILKAKTGAPPTRKWPGAYWTIRVEHSDFDGDWYWLSDHVAKAAFKSGFWERASGPDATCSGEDDLPPLVIGKRFGIDPALVNSKKEPFKTIRRLAKYGIDFKVMRKGGGDVEINTTHGNHGGWIMKEDAVNSIRRKS